MYLWLSHAGSVALVLLLVPVAGARGQNSRGSPRPPPITPLRYSEDYSYLRDPKNRSGMWWEQFKFLPLSATGSTYLTLGDETRLRYEHYWDNEFGSAVKPDDGYLRFRELPYVGLHLGPELQIFGQLQAAWSTRDSLVKSRFTDETGVDLLRAWLSGGYTSTPPFVHAPDSQVTLQWRAVCQHHNPAKTPPGKVVKTTRSTSSIPRTT